MAGAPPWASRGHYGRMALETWSPGGGGLAAAWDPERVRTAVAKP